MKETSGSSGACVVAVTGAYGFIGRHVCDALQRGPYRVVKVNRSSEGVPDICSDLSNAAELARDLRADGVKVLVHSAWAGHPRSAGTDYPGQIRDSLVPTINTLLAAGLAGVDHVVLLGTGGGIPPARGATAPPAYGWAKRTAEGIALANASAFQFRLAIIRPSAVYGPGQDPSRGLGAVTVFADAILRNQPIRILGSDSVTRDFLHVGDLSEAVRYAVDAQLDGTYELGGPEGVSLRDVITAIEHATGRTANVELLPATGVDPQTVLLDNAPFTRKTGWTPSKRVEDSLDELLHSLATHHAGQAP